MKPVDVKMPVPTMFETTRAVALHTPNRRCNRGEAMEVEVDIKERLNQRG
jgi:hypothetical protein